MDTDTEPSVCRRSVVTAMLAMAAMPAAFASPTLEETVNQKARELADALAEMHGGAWRIHVDHVAGLAAVSREVSG